MLISIVEPPWHNILWPTDDTVAVISESSPFVLRTSTCLDIISLTYLPSARSSLRHSGLQVVVIAVSEGPRVRRRTLPPCWGSPRRNGVRLRSDWCRENLHHVRPRASPWTRSRPRGSPSRREPREVSRRSRRHWARKRGRRRYGGTRAEINALPLPADLGAAARGDDADASLILRDLQRGCVRPPCAGRPPPPPGTASRLKTRRGSPVLRIGTNGRSDARTCEGRAWEER